jgi:hypothetical protein
MHFASSEIVTKVADSGQQGYKGIDKLKNIERSGHK